jgi:hypothetical protein
MEFKALEDVFVYVEKKGGAKTTGVGELPIAQGEIAKVPCKKGEIFSNRSLGMLEKRVLMKFLQVSLHEVINGTILDMLITTH